MDRTEVEVIDAFKEILNEAKKKIFVWYPLCKSRICCKGSQVGFRLSNSKFDVKLLSEMANHVVKKLETFLDHDFLIGIFSNA